MSTFQRLFRVLPATNLALSSKSWVVSELFHPNDIYVRYMLAVLKKNEKVLSARYIALRSKKDVN